MRPQLSQVTRSTSWSCPRQGLPSELVVQQEVRIFTHLPTPNNIGRCSLPPKQAVNPLLVGTILTPMRAALTQYENGGDIFTQTQHPVNARSFEPTSAETVRISPHSKTIPFSNHLDKARPRGATLIRPLRAKTPIPRADAGEQSRNVDPGKSIAPSTYFTRA
jgi:hypothetical protein